jgi:cell division protein FtsB
MQSKEQNLGEVYAARAMAESEPPVSTMSIPKIREARDMVYNGIGSLPSGETTAGAPAPRNKKANRRKVSPFTIILLLLGTSVASVLYIGNILAVGRLMAQINQLQTKHQQILNEQELLKAQMNRLAGLDRIQQIAQNQLGLQNSKQLPIWIVIDPERVNQIEEAFQQQMEHKR